MFMNMNLGLAMVTTSYLAQNREPAYEYATSRNNIVGGLAEVRATGLRHV